MDHSYSFRHIVVTLYLFVLLGLCYACHPRQQTYQKPTQSRIETTNPATGKINSMDCSSNRGDLVAMIRHYADSVTALNLKYDQASANDCSGTFIRLNQYLDAICPNPYFPSFAKARSTRDLIQYYYKQGSLKLINKPLSASEYIKPGAIMFYAKRGMGGQLKITADKLQSYVNHVGVVYETTVNKQTGVVEKYSLFHGRNPKRGIGITTYHSRQPYSNQNKPYPYGNGQEQWIAVAPILGN